MAEAWISVSSPHTFGPQGYPTTSEWAQRHWGVRGLQHPLLCGRFTEDEDPCGTESYTHASCDFTESYTQASCDFMESYTQASCDLAETKQETSDC